MPFKASPSRTAAPGAPPGPAPGPASGPVDDAAPGPDPEAGWEDGSPGAAGSKPAPGLYLVALPIGNLRDITLRALDLLRDADTLAVEDTRVTRKLLARYGLERSMVAYHEHNAERMRPRLLDSVAAGQVVALASDAGLPTISDPGFKLVREARERGLPVTCLPGASAVTTALAVAGLPTDRFLFAGFLPPRTARRRGALAELAGVPASLVFFETAPRLAAALADMADSLGDREAAVTRELTKRHEEVRRGRLAALAAHYAAAGPPRGEICVVVGPPEATPAGAEDGGAELDRLLDAALARGESLRDAVDAAATATGRPRKQVYRRALDRAGPAEGGGDRS
ncbi:MAG: 16S rRNA (cytidine(1402)-2'-O)-methyltransferase [Azospirillaceae bacterium]